MKSQIQSEIVLPSNVSAYLANIANFVIFRKNSNVGIYLAHC